MLCSHSGMVSKQPEHADSPRSKRYYECLETQRGRERWNRAGIRLGGCWSGGLSSCSSSTAADEAEGQLPHHEKMHQKKENEGCKNLDEKRKLCITLSDLPLKWSRVHILLYVIIFILQKTDIYSSRVLYSSCLRNVLVSFCPEQ